MDSDWAADDWAGDDASYDRAIAERNWNRLQDTHGVVGYKEGLIEGKEAHIQAGFDSGYRRGWHIGRRIGRLQGIVAGALQLASKTGSPKDAAVVTAAFRALPSDADLASLQALHTEIQAITADSLFDAAFHKAEQSQSADPEDLSLHSQHNGAARVELCANLLEGGTTPSAGTIRLCRASIKIPMHVMIRPRGGDFCYSDLEVEIMRQDIRTAKELGADGVVLGLLRPDGSIDTLRTADLVREAAPMSVTFHRAFDMTSDPFKAIEDLIAIGGIQRILTSGQDSGALEGLPLLKQLVTTAADRITILPGGGVTPRNMDRIIDALRVQEIHMALPTTIASQMQFRNPNVFMGIAITTPEYDRSVTDAVAVRAVTARLAK
eukprot:jgi/Hompol1/4389/HPOL_003625-RA